MFLTSPNDQKYQRYPLVLKINGHFSTAAAFGNSVFFKWKFLSDVRRL